jgi:hypothetical protein
MMPTRPDRPDRSDTEDLDWDGADMIITEREESPRAWFDTLYDGILACSTLGAS